MTQQAHKQQDSNTVNGVDLDILGGTVQAVADYPELGKCHFRASNTWHGGTDNRSTVSGFYGAKQEIPHRQAFVMRADEPRPGLSPEEALREAPEGIEDKFAVPKFD